MQWSQPYPRGRAALEVLGRVKGRVGQRGQHERGGSGMADARRST
jgi:hypothetical protein